MNIKGKRQKTPLLLPFNSLFSLGLLLFLLGVGGCSPKKPTTQSEKKTTAPPKFDTSLVFNNVTLDQADEKGRRLWTVKAKQANYSTDKKTANVQSPIGDLFQDGILVLQVKATQGVVQEDGKKIFLQGQIEATDPRNGAVLKGEELEWRPQEDLLIVRKNLVGTHPKLHATANEGRYFSRAQKLELQGQIVADSTDPHLKMKTEHLIWEIPQEKVTGDQSIQIDRYQDQTITEQAVGNQSEVYLKTKIVTLRQNVKVNSLNPPIEITGSVVSWNLNTEMVVSDQPVRIWHQKEQVTLIANQGQVSLKQQVAVLTGNAKGVANRNQATLYANRITWIFPTQQVLADGNVNYLQVNPPLNLKGPSAVGRLQDQNVVVTGSTGSRVVTEIIP